MVHLHIFIEMGDVMYLKRVGLEHPKAYLIQAKAKKEVLNKLKRFIHDWDTKKECLTEKGLQRTTLDYCYLTLL
jgi:hypothetical protein